MEIDALRLTEADFKGKGVSAQANPMELPEDEAKAVFDQLVKEVLTPRFNTLLETLAPLDLTEDAEKPVSAAQQAALDRKVDRAKRTGSETEEKVLSDNNYDDTEKENVRLNTQKRHAHDNKATLDQITAQDLQNWNGGNVLTKDNETPFAPTGEYQPATKKYVDERVVDIGAADMTQAVYDPKGRREDIFAAIDDAKYLTDDVSGERFYLGVSGGALFVARKEDAGE